MAVSALLVLLASGVYPLAFIIYGQVVNTLVDLQKAAIMSAPDFNSTGRQMVENVSLSDGQEFW